MSKLRTDFDFKNLIFLSSLAPVRCLQFYYQPTGIVKNFNFIDSPSTNPNSIIRKTIHNII
jgi:hypothetical protein